MRSKKQNNHVYLQWFTNDVLVMKKKQWRKEDGVNVGKWMLVRYLYQHNFKNVRCLKYLFGWVSLIWWNICWYLWIQYSLLIKYEYSLKAHIHFWNLFEIPFSVLFFFQQPRAAQLSISAKIHVMSSGLSSRFFFFPALLPICNQMRVGSF